MFPHSYAVLFSIKMCFDETNNVFISRTKQNHAKLSTASKIAVKINVMLLGTLLEILRRKTNKDFYNIFETTNAMALVKTISDSLYKVLKIP